MKTFLLVGVALLGAVTANAQEKSAVYVGVGVGQATIEEEVFSATYDASSTGFKVFGGYQVNPYFGAELAYLDTGTAEDTLFGVKVEASATALQVSLLPTLPVSESVSLYARLALLAWELEAQGTQGNVVASIKDDGNDFSWGVGATFVNGALGFRLEYERADIDETTFDLISAGVFFRF